MQLPRSLRASAPFVMRLACERNGQVRSFFALVGNTRTLEEICLDDLEVGEIHLLRISAPIEFDYHACLLGSTAPADTNRPAVWNYGRGHGNPLQSVIKDMIFNFALEPNELGRYFSRAKNIRKGKIPSHTMKV